VLRADNQLQEQGRYHALGNILRSPNGYTISLWFLAELETTDGFLNLDVIGYFGSLAGQKSPRNATSVMPVTHQATRVLTTLLYLAIPVFYSIAGLNNKHLKP
jgi:hypothetical protein